MVLKERGGRGRADGSGGDFGTLGRWWRGWSSRELVAGRVHVGESEREVWASRLEEEGARGGCWAEAGRREKGPGARLG